MSTADLIARERVVTSAHRPDRGATEWVVSVVDGPQDLLARSTREAALADGAEYVAAKWARRADGTWVPR